jgi:hypothetical protein
MVVLYTGIPIRSGILSSSYSDIPSGLVYLLYIRLISTTKGIINKSRKSHHSDEVVGLGSGGGGGGDSVVIGLGGYLTLSMVIIKDMNKIRNNNTFKINSFSIY